MRAKLTLNGLLRNFRVMNLPFFHWTKLTWAALILSPLMTYAQERTQPRLVVSIVVDQMRPDYLTRFAPHYKGGFARLMEEGQIFADAHYTHTPTYTGPGHATIYTGTDPRFHGIIANDWYDPIMGRMVYCVEDSTARAIGQVAADDAYYTRSPRNLESSTWTDELEMTSQGAAKVVAFSLKDRGAICAAGHAGDAAYWLHDAGGFVTSDHYMEALPSWLSEFNTEHSPSSYMTGEWTPLLDNKHYEALCGLDASQTEAIPSGHVSTAFPYDLAKMYQAYQGSIKSTPAGNQILVDAAIQAVKSEKLGKDAQTDVLAISFSSTDYIGHATGVRSWETMDMYIRLDRQLGQLFKFLDRIVGKDDYIVVLTADHGAADNPKEAAAQGLPTTIWPPADLEAELRAVIASTGLAAEHVLMIRNEQIHLATEDAAVHTRVRQALLQHPAIAEAWTRDEVRTSADPAAALRRNGSDARSGHVFFALAPGHIIYGPTGTTHGSGYAYDTHVPVIFLIPGMKGRTYVDRVHVRDIAPTISHWIRIPQPTASTGHILDIY